MSNNLNIKLLPYELLKGEGCNSACESLFDRDESESEHNFFEDYTPLFLESGKAGIRLLMERLGLERGDEVYIASTSNSSYVSSCVTCTLFNYCKVSRVLTEKTKLIWIIHEFGFPNPEIWHLLDYASRHGIPVGEDSAHSLDSFIDGKRLGFNSDFGLFSLPKTFPVKTGGVLVVKNLSSLGMKVFDVGDCMSALANFADYLPYLRAISKRRQQIYLKYRDAFSDNNSEIYEFSERVSPYVYGVMTDKAEAVYKTIDCTFSELMPTYNKNWLTLSTNAFIDDVNLNHFIELVGEILGLHRVNRANAFR